MSAISEGLWFWNLLKKCHQKSDRPSFLARLGMSKIFANIIFACQMGNPFHPRRQIVLLSINYQFDFPQSCLSNTCLNGIFLVNSKKLFHRKANSGKSKFEGENWAITVTVNICLTRLCFLSLSLYPCVQTLGRWDLNKTKNWYFWPTNNNHNLKTTWGRYISIWVKILLWSFQLLKLFSSNITNMDLCVPTCCA